MVKYIVQIHPVEAGQPNLYKVRGEHEFHFKASAVKWMEGFNRVHAATEDEPEEFRAVYRGCVDTDTGDLVEDAHEGLC
jgi:hypothetical protein